MKRISILFALAPLAWLSGTSVMAQADEHLRVHLDFATCQGEIYEFHIIVKAASYGYYDLLSTANGYTHIDSEAALVEAMAAGSYFVIASDDADSQERFHQDYIRALISVGGEGSIDLSALIFNPDFAGNGWPGWTVTGSWGNQRFNGAAEDAPQRDLHREWQKNARKVM